MSLAYCDINRESLRVWREGRGYTQEEMARQMGLTINQYCEVERGKKRFTRLHRLAFLALINDMEHAREPTPEDIEEFVKDITTEEIIRWRTERKLGQRKFCRMIGMSHDYVCDRESGRRGLNYSDHDKFIFRVLRDGIFFRPGKRELEYRERL